ncbi:hypothetical protein JOC77_000481 [Peribacillus deserti]|uniref:DUF2512 domain-containing protein n=1 Tax=Peribacillus deserti TaxID=673318 RepID=A0ABS2QFJ4_9BACI|nr:YndM family protein [Peribacillus deserti]MBM7691076.1 hypothetical protein [Peribacillus deserti]
MRHILPLLIKFIATFSMLGIILGLFNNFSIFDVLVISILLTVIAYILGDLVILRRTNNLIATAADFGLAFFLIWLLSRNLTFQDNLVSASLAAALGVTLFEYIFHRIIPRGDNRSVQAKGHQSKGRGSSRFQTEASEDLTPVRPDVRSKKENEDEKNN